MGGACVIAARGATPRSPSGNVRPDLRSEVYSHKDASVETRALADQVKQGQEVSIATDPRTGDAAQPVFKQHDAEHSFPDVQFSNRSNNGQATASNTSRVEVSGDGRGHTPRKGVEKDSVAEVRVPQLALGATPSTTIKGSDDIDNTLEATFNQETHDTQPKQLQGGNSQRNISE